MSGRRYLCTKFFERENKSLRSESLSHISYIKVSLCLSIHSVISLFGLNLTPVHIQNFKVDFSHIRRVVEVEPIV